MAPLSILVLRTTAPWPHKAQTVPKVPEKARPLHATAANETEDALAYGTDVISQVGRDVGPDGSCRDVYPLSIEENLDSLAAHASRRRPAVPITTARAAIGAQPLAIEIGMVRMMVARRDLCTTVQREQQGSREEKEPDEEEPGALCGSGLLGHVLSPFDSGKRIAKFSS
jgi:hypothetical protein